MDDLEHGDEGVFVYLRPNSSRSIVVLIKLISKDREIVLLMFSSFGRLAALDPSPDPQRSSAPNSSHPVASAVTPPRQDPSLPLINEDAPWLRPRKKPKN